MFLFAKAMKRIKTALNRLAIHKEGVTMMSVVLVMATKSVTMVSVALVIATKTVTMGSVVLTIATKSVTMVSVELVIALYKCGKGAYNLRKE